ncbi:MAG: hypothetical protein GC150_09940 [Rhizobiales bacterium]|nr:hypothetical protein [Hyphomicrobiales bacterium]
MRVGEKRLTPERYSRTEAAGEAPDWPMPVADFLAGHHLERADVLLSRRHGSLFSWAIRRLTKSQFSHAGLVFLVPHREAEFDGTFIIEAGTKGVDLTNLAEYLNDRASVVAIKRFRSIPRIHHVASGQRPEAWFNDEVQKRVRGRLLNSIKADYSYRTVFSILRSLLDRASFTVASGIRGRKAALESRRRRGYKAPNAYICSGLVQLGFLDAVVDLVRRGVLPPSAVREVVFDREMATILPQDWSAFDRREVLDIIDQFMEGWSEELNAIKPVDLARTLQLEWRYVIVDGWAHRVRSYEETYELLRWSPNGGTRVRGPRRTASAQAAGPAGDARPPARSGGRPPAASPRGARGARPELPEAAVSRTREERRGTRSLAGTDRPPQGGATPRGRL